MKNVVTTKKTAPIIEKILNMSSLYRIWVYDFIKKNVQCTRTWTRETTDARSRTVGTTNAAPPRPALALATGSLPHIWNESTPLAHCDDMFTLLTRPSSSANFVDETWPRSASEWCSFVMSCDGATSHPWEVRTPCTKHCVHIAVAGVVTHDKQKVHADGASGFPTA